MIKNECNLCCIKVEDLSVRLGGTQILSNINLHIHCGELTVIVGKNGAGKTTLFKALLKEIPYTGKVSYLDAHENKTGTPLLGHVPQKILIDPNTPATVQDLFCAHLSKIPIWLYQKKSLQKQSRILLEQVKGEDLINKKLGHLSGGELQRVLLALSLSHSPNLLLLDEPFTGVDQDGMKLFYEIVSNLRKKFDLSIMLITHDLPLVSQYADRVIVLDKTILYNGTYVDMKNSSRGI